MSLPRLARGDLVAVTLPPGEPWTGVLAAAWEAEAALLPVDHRLPAPARRSLLARAAPTVILGEDGWQRVPAGPPCEPSVALVMATSGSTRHPRLVELTRDAVSAAVAASLIRLGAGPRDGWVSCLPLAHIGGLLVLLRGQLGGGPVRFRAPDAGLAPEPGHPFASVVPTQLVRALDGGRDLSGFRTLLVGGSAMAPELRERAGAAGAPVLLTYGQTESCGGVVYDGLPLPGVAMRISATGEIELGGPTLMRGYRDPVVAEGGRGAAAPRPRRRAAPPPPGPGATGWLRTGDAGWIDAEGRLHVHGRLDEVIVTGGEKVWPGEVEAVLRRHPGVADCAVFARDDREWGQRVVVAVVPRVPGAPPSLGALRDLVGATLGRHHAPREVLAVASLPRTPLGKLRRGELIDLAR